MFRKLFAVVLVLSLVGVTSASNMAGQNHSIDAMVAAMNLGNGGPDTGGVVGQFGGTVSASDGHGMVAAQEAGVGIAAVTVMGPGAAMAGLGVDAMQMVASGGGTGTAIQGAEVGAGVALLKAPGMGGLSATSSAVVNQAEVVNTPAGTISNSNTSGVSTIAAQGPCSTGTVVTNVSVESCQVAAFVNPCPPPICPPVCPPCPQPCPPCGGDC